VQIATASTAAMVLSLSATFPQALTPCNWVVVVVGWHDTLAEASQVTDSAGNTYVRGINGGTSALGLSQTLWYAKAIASAATNTIAVTFDQSAAAPDALAVEYAGITDIDWTNRGNGGATVSGTYGVGPVSVTTTMAPELLFGAGICDGKFTKGGPGFVVRTPAGSDFLVQDEVVNKAGTFGSSATVTPPAGGGEWVMHIATFY
jgi:hypothetical protein